MTPALKLTPAIGEDDLVRLEELLSWYRAEASDYQDGAGSLGDVIDVYRFLERLCLSLGMGAGSDAEVWAEGVLG